MDLIFGISHAVGMLSYLSAAGALFICMAGVE
jgi:hypothetical protein